MRRVIVRFESKDDLDTFSQKLSIELSPNVKELYLPSRTIKYRREARGKNPPIDVYKNIWIDMPEYVSEKQEPYAKIDIFFEIYSLKYLSKIFEQKITDRATSIWFPKLIAGKHSKLRVVGGESTTKYPVYIVSKGRPDKCYTSRFLSQMEVEHYIVVEPQEVKLYRENIDNRYATILELDMTYKNNYDSFDDLGDTKPKGPGGARNFCWEHSIKSGFKRHWVMDDNTSEGFHYMNHNRKQKCRTGAIFRACESFVDRYTNIAIAGLNYSKFCKEGDKTPPYVLNTRIYSYLLIQNDLPYRWRGRYNEDTDLSLRVLKDGLCTIQFNAFLAGKKTTQAMDGGNTDEFYSKEGTYPKSKMLEDMHPDVAEVVWKFSRWHHQVDYSGFTQALKLKPDIRKKWKVKAPDRINNFGMIVIDTNEVETTDSKSYLENKYLI